MKIENHLVLRYEDTEESILYAEVQDILRVTEEVAQQFIDSRIRFTKGKLHFMIADVSKVMQVSSGAKELLQNPDGGMKNLLGAAIIASNPVSALIANIFIKTPKQFEARFFWNKEDAFAWILECRLRVVSKMSIK